MIKLIAATFLGLGISLIAGPVLSTPNHCEFIIIEILDSVDRGDLTEEEGDQIINNCAESLWREQKYS